MDQFHEESVSKDKTGLNTFIYFILYVFMIIFAITAIMTLNTLFASIASGGKGIVFVIIQLVLTGGLTFGCYVLKNNQRIEYDYTLTNGVLDVAKVINNSKRKKVLSADVKEFEVIAPISDPGFQRMLNYKGIQKKYNVFLNRNSKLYYGVFTHEGVKSLIVFEPSEEMLNSIKVFIPRNVKIA